MAPGAQWAVLGCTIVVGLLVYVISANAGHPPPNPDHHVHTITQNPVGSPPLAPSYTDLGTFGQRGPNADFTSELASLRAPSEELPSRTRATVLAERARQRAYAGAPPTVPHAIDQQSASSCLACHAQGIRVGNRLAPALSHEPYASCTQCHVEDQNRSLAAVQQDDALINMFVGATEQQGPRSTLIGAPPQLPHPLHMRGDCLSCHGPTSEPALQTRHPKRLNCLQCHTPAQQAVTQGGFER